ncbi:hypothetical protein LTR50_006637 [Elasticomyces elasticus]|nr:hypothetical protein LTR50_006637 [Elasticomyces elasticus]
MATDPKQRKRKRLTKLTRDRNHTTANRDAGAHRSGFSTSTNVWCFTMPFFSNVFKNKDGPVTSPNQRTAVHDTNQGPAVPPKPRYASSWNSKEMVPEEVQDLIHACTQEMKSRADALDTPLLLLPFRPGTDPSSARTFIRNFFHTNAQGGDQYRGTSLQQELRLTDPIVLCSIIKWCWSRMPGGVVTWNVYEMFTVGEQESKMTVSAFDSFIPMCVESEARRAIIYDFFDLLSAIAAHGKINGLGGRKLSRMAGWWAFDHSDDGKGFEGGYKSWARSADATSHLFFAYLRSQSPDVITGISGISQLPRSLQALVAQTEYPPETPVLMQTSTAKVVMIVDAVSPTPFALLRRAKHFEYRDDDRVLQQLSAFEDPTLALTEECKRVLDCISSANHSSVPLSSDSRAPIRSDESWSRFQDMGFSSFSNGDNGTQNLNGSTPTGFRREPQGLRSGSRKRDHVRPTTPSWADFLNTGFADENGTNGVSPLLLPPDKFLPPIGDSRAIQSDLEGEDLEPGELASITQFELDGTFWWVWMTSLAGEEPVNRKAVFGRCALIETNIGGNWLLMEEQVKGASPMQEEGAYIAEKKGRFSAFTRRGKLGRRRSSVKQPARPEREPFNRAVSTTPSMTSIPPDQQARIKAAAAALAQKQDQRALESSGQRRGRHEETVSTKTNSVFTLGLMGDAAPAMKWANDFDKSALRAKYLGANVTPSSVSREKLSLTAPSTNEHVSVRSTPSATASPTSLASPVSPTSPTLPIEFFDRDLPALPNTEYEVPAPKQVEPSSPPAQLVKAPIVTVAPIDETADEVTQVPLSEATTFDRRPYAHAPPAQISPTTPRRVSDIVRKPVPRASDHPALRQTPEQPRSMASELELAQQATRRAWDSKNTSPETSEMPSWPQSQKRSGSGGLKRLFGRMKSDSSSRGLLAAQPTANNMDLQPRQQSSLSRRLSFVRKKSSPAGIPVASQTAATPVPASPHSSADPKASSSDGFAEPTSPHMSHADSQDRHDVHHQFSRFDQGTLSDMPAYTPRDYDDHIAETPPAPRFQTRAAALLHPTAAGTNHPPPEHATPTDQDDDGDDDDDANDAASEASQQPEALEETARLISLNERWAQIRRNAAERATARGSEEQSLRSRPSLATTIARTDEGETSGEESIEARVARIKARVAELTGNIDAQGSRMDRMERR